MGAEVDNQVAAPAATRTPEINVAVGVNECLCLL
jgi:hypothetical protein